MRKKLKHNNWGYCLWHNAKLSLPDDETTVLVCMEDGEVWTGFRDAGVWRYVSAELVETTVTHWAEFPEPPTR